MRLSLAMRWLPIEPTHTLPTLMRVPYPLSIAEGLSLVARADYNLGRGGFFLGQHGIGRPTLSTHSIAW